jgi:hypothetical protein
VCGGCRVVLCRVVCIRLQCLSDIPLQMAGLYAHNRQHTAQRTFSVMRVKTRSTPRHRPHAPAQWPARRDKAPLREAGRGLQPNGPFSFITRSATRTGQVNAQDRRRISQTTNTERRCNGERCTSAESGDRGAYPLIRRTRHYPRCVCPVSHGLHTNETKRRIRANGRDCPSKEGLVCFPWARSIARFL